MWRDGVLSGAMLVLLAGLAAGALLGWAYFVALWASVSRLQQRPAGAWFAAALLARLAVATTLLALVGRWGGAPALLGALAGFIVVRVLMLRRAGSRPATADRRP
jgi:F1F0 ATPase subunit 2